MTISLLRLLAVANLAMGLILPPTAGLAPSFTGKRAKRTTTHAVVLDANEEKSAEKVVAVNAPPAKGPAQGAKPASRKPDAGNPIEKHRAIRVPTKTPFDGDATKRSDYLRSYRDGYSWAQGIHLWCPTNPSDDNLHAIRGWVEGWRDGVAAGGQADLPAKYAPFVAWREEAKP